MMSSWTDDRSLNYHAGADVFPQSYNQLARQRRDHHLLEAAAILGDTLVDPATERRARLMA